MPRVALLLVREPLVAVCAHHANGSQPETFGGIPNSNSHTIRRSDDPEGLMAAPRCLLHARPLKLVAMST